jgi:TonB family protein
MPSKIGWIVLVGAFLVAGIEARHSVVFAQEQRSVAREIKRRVAPDYPELAKRMNLTGKVKVEVVIAPAGQVTLTRAIGGHPVLVQAAERAIKEWKFAPASETTTQIIEMVFAGTEVH